MKRNDFLKISGLAATGLILPPLNLLPGANRKRIRLHMPDNQRQVMLLDIDRDSELWFGWLVKLVGSSLITALSAKIIDKWTGDCFCNGTSCSANNADTSNYGNIEGIYGYTGTGHRFITQELRDRQVNFTNASVPFLDQGNSKISSLEGPFLAGACWAAEDIAGNYGVEATQSVISPEREISNGGFRFDTNPCYPSKYKTDYGTTEIDYKPNGAGTGGDVIVKVKDALDNLDWKKTYEFSA